MSIGQIMAECGCQHTACDLRGYCMAARIAELEARVARLLDIICEAHDAMEGGCDADAWAVLRDALATLDKERK